MNKKILQVFLATMMFVLTINMAFASIPIPIPCEKIIIEDDDIIDEVAEYLEKNILSAWSRRSGEISSYCKRTPALVFEYETPEAYSSLGVRYTGRFIINFSPSAAVRNTLPVAAWLDKGSIEQLQRVAGAAARTIEEAETDGRVREFHSFVSPQVLYLQDKGGVSLYDKQNDFDNELIFCNGQIPYIKVEPDLPWTTMQQDDFLKTTNGSWFIGHLRQAERVCSLPSLEEIDAYNAYNFRSVSYFYDAWGTPIAIVLLLLTSGILIWPVMRRKYKSIKTP